MSRFALFGPDHLGALAAIAAVSYGLARAVAARRARGPSLGLRLGLALALVAAIAFELTIAAREGWLTLEVALPLHLCDAAMLLAVAALLTLRRALAEVLYFWACSGSVLALVTPDLPFGFPRFEFLVFFGLHGLTVIAAVILVFGFGLAPRAGAHWRVFLLTNAYAAFVGLVNLMLGTNYLYLCAKPLQPTILDLFGPWPLYLLIGDGLALLAFYLLALPFRGETA